MSLPFKYRKKPVEIEAMLFDGTIGSAEAIHAWSSGKCYVDKENIDGVESYVIRVQTLEGLMTGRENDHIVKGIEGEFYPVKDTIFDATYELV